MRRAGVVGLVLGLVLARVAVADAEPKVAVTAEGGAEMDSNVQRFETGPGLTTRRVAAPVARLGAKLSHTGRVARGGYGLAVGALSRTVMSGDQDLSPENVVLLSGDVRWMRPIGRRAVSAGIALAAIDALPITDGVGSRTFRTLGGEGLVTLGGEARSLTIAVGGRDFVYKPDPADRYDWRGPAASIRLELTLWERDEGARSVELSALFGFEARAYDSFANASACPQDAPPKEECFTGTSLRRSDRFQRGGLELTWTGRFVAAAAYQLSVTDSNSYGQSIVRHRLTLSATRDLPWRLYGTALATVQLDHYPDGLPIDRDPQTQTFTTLDDENRSSLQVRIARPVARAWAIEGRGAIWRNLGSELDSEFRRAVLYVGAVYNH
jgi:hypothetical protein